MNKKLWLAPSATLPIILMAVSFLLGDAVYSNTTERATIGWSVKYLLMLVLISLLVLDLVFILFAVRRVGKRQQLRHAKNAAMSAFAVIGLGFFLAVNIVGPYFRARHKQRDDMGGRCTPIVREGRTEALCEELT